MKRMFVFLIMVLMLGVLPTSVFAAGEGNSGKDTWKGNVYYDQEITEKNNMKAKLQQIDIKVDGNKISLSGKVKYDKQKHSLNLNGDLYVSPKDYYNGDKLLAKFQDTDKFKFLSFTIDNDTKGTFLLKPNKPLKGKQVVRLALLNKKTNDIIFFEDKLNSLSYKNIKDNAISVTGKKSENKELLGELSAIDTWYIPFMNDFESDKSKDESVDTNNEKVEGNQPVSLMSTLPSGVPESEFKTEGSETKNNNYYGWYKESTEWPAGSGNIITYLIRWDYNETEPSSTEDEIWFNFKITDSNQYLYQASDDSIAKYDDDSYLRIEDVDLRVWIKEGDQDFIYKRSFTGDSTDGDLNYMKTLVSLIPYAKDLASVHTNLTSDSPTEQTINSGYVTWADTIYEQEIDNDGEVVRNVGGKMDSSNYIKEENDYINLGAYVGDEGYGTKKVYYYTEFVVMGRDSWARYTQEKYDSSQGYYRSYTR